MEVEALLLAYKPRFLKLRFFFPWNARGELAPYLFLAWWLVLTYFVMHSLFKFWQHIKNLLLILLIFSILYENYTDNRAVLILFQAGMFPLIIGNSRMKTSNQNTVSMVLPFPIIATKYVHTLNKPLFTLLRSWFMVWIMHSNSVRKKTLVVFIAFYCTIQCLL